jgi:hypothetical protein
MSSQVHWTGLSLSLGPWTVLTLVGLSQASQSAVQSEVSRSEVWSRANQSVMQSEVNLSEVWSRVNQSVVQSEVNQSAVLSEVKPSDPKMAPTKGLPLGSSS